MQHSAFILPRALIGNSPGARKLLRQIDKVSKARWPVLILGETGTGKEVIARSIHEQGPSGPFVVVDCSSLVGPLMESELFGYTRGAFTGANTAKLGLIEMANGGTAFFDEIGELPLELQSKLLRVLQEKEFRPVGALNLRRSDFRVISATNRDLAAEVEKGTFRRDLYYRLNVITIRVPTLRDRKDDIPELLAWFVRKHGGNHTFTQEAIDALASYDWPGNIRELENCVQHMLAVNSGPFLHTHDLSSQLMNHILEGQASLLTMAASVEHRPSSDSKPGSAVVSLPEMERRAIFEALSQTKGDRATAAALLGIGRTTLYRKLKEYNLG